MPGAVERTGARIAHRGQALPACGIGAGRFLYIPFANAAKRG